MGEPRPFVYYQGLPHSARRAIMAKLVVIALLLPALVVDSEARYSAPKEYDDMTNINIWQCHNSTGQQWYDIHTLHARSVTVHQLPKIEVVML